jgi:DNA-directed RNA polymerase specialized sigma subunit
VLGSAEFFQHVKEHYLGNRVGSRDLPALRQIYKGIDTEAVMAIVAEGLAKHPKPIRNASLYLYRKRTGQQLRTIGQRFGISNAAVSQVCKRFKARIDND